MPKRSVSPLVLLLILLLGGAVAALVAGRAVLHNENARYRVSELVFNARFHRYDDVIESVAKSRAMDPMLVKAVVWRESRFRSDKVGLDGERGLMQITDAAASEWVKAEKVASFVPADLFDPKTNIQAGTWLLARSLRRYQDRDDPVPFALAEYNAGRSRVTRWTGEKETGTTNTPAVNSKELLAKIDFPRTRQYVETVLDRIHFYHERGRL